MNDLEQRLADELGAVATELRTPRVAVPGLVAAGRRERVRRRSAVAGLVAAVVAVVATSSVAGLRGDHDRAVEPAPAPVVDDLARPLSLPWWETIDDQDDPDMGVLHAAGSETPFRATDVRYLQGRTFVGNDAQRWWELVEGALEPVADLPLTGPPVVGPDSARLWVEDTGTDYGVGVALRDGSGTAFSLPPGERPLAIGLTEDGRLLMTRGAEVFLGRDGRRGPTPVLGVPEGAEIAARAGGFALYAGGRVVADGSTTPVGSTRTGAPTVTARASGRTTASGTPRRPTARCGSRPGPERPTYPSTRTCCGSSAGRARPRWWSRSGSRSTGP
jgi:hypothetical protein